MVMLQRGYLNRMMPSTESTRIRSRARIAAQKCGLNVNEGLGNEDYICTVLDKLVKDNSDFIMEVQSLEEQLAYLSEHLTPQTSATIADDEEALDVTAPQLLSTADAAKLLGVTTQSVRNWIENGRLTGIKQAGGTSWGYVFFVVDDEKLEQLIQEKRR